MYPLIRKIVGFTFIGCVVIFAIVAILAVWNVVEKDAISKSFESMLAITIGLSLIGITTLAREGKLTAGGTSNHNQISVGRIILYVIVVAIALPILLTFMRALMFY